MNSLPLSLFQLEEIDSRIETDLVTIESLRGRLRGDPDIVAAGKRVEELEKRVLAAEANQRRLEGVVEDTTRTIDRLNKTLYGGSIHDSREMASVEKEIEHAGASRSNAEDGLLEAMETSENLQSELQGARSRSASLSNKRNDSLAGMRDDMQRLLAEVSVLREKRIATTAAIDEIHLQRYEILRARHRHAVSHVQDGVCQWCRVQIPRADLQHARSGALIMCTNCSRILYVDATAI